MKLLSVSLALTLFLLFPALSDACSLTGCDKGFELRREFVVRITHGGKPLPGVSVRITGSTEQKINELFFRLTAADGTVRVADLPPGEYWLNAELLGITAVFHCFHVNSRTSRKAKKKVNYEWGDEAPATRQIAGRLIDSQPGQGGTPLWNLLHRVEVPISEARMKLQNPLTGAVHNTVSDANGHFSFDGVPSGTYVIHIEGGTTLNGRDYDSTDQLIQLSETAKSDSLLLKRREASAGSCGGTHLELQNPS